MSYFFNVFFSKIHKKNFVLPETKDKNCCMFASGIGPQYFEISYKANIWVLVTFLTGLVC